MTLSDQDLARTYETAKRIEAQARQVMQQPDLAERDAALTVCRHAIALKKACETWIADRAVRVTLQHRIVA